MKKTARYFFLLIVAFITILKINAQTVLLDSISSHLEKQLLKNKNECLSFAILKGDSMIYFKGFGHIDQKNKILPDSSTIFRIGSITKSFTSVLMLQLVAEGYFKLDDPIEKYVPEIKNLNGYTDSTKITFRQLASHTAGLEREPEIKGLSKGPTSEWESKVLFAIPETKFICKPNTKMNYSNIGYAILGLAISRATHVSFIKLITDRIFIPLNMQSSYFDVPYDKRKNLAIGIDEDGSINVPDQQHAGRGYRVPNGGIYSTVYDLSKFVSVLMGTSKHKIISDESLAVMEKAREPFSSTSYGLGASVYTLQNNTIVIGHGGLTPGYMTYYAFDKLRKNGVIIMLNFKSNENLSTLAINILNQLPE